MLSIQQNKDYADMPFVDLCDLIDDLTNKIELLEEENKDLIGRIAELENENN